MSKQSETKLKPGEFHNEKLECKFSLPEPIRMRHVEAYEKARETARKEGSQSAPSINWVGAVEIIENWECKALPDPNKTILPEDLADVYGDALKTVYWVGSQVAIYVMSKLIIPKN